MWKNMVQPDRPQVTIWRMRIACWITKATNLRAEYVILTVFSTTSAVARTRLTVTSYVGWCQIWSDVWEEKHKYFFFPVRFMSACVVKQRYRSTHSQGQRYMGVSGQNHTPAALSPGMEPCTFCVGGCVGPQKWSRRVWRWQNILPQQRLELRSVEAVVESIY